MGDFNCNLRSPLPLAENFKRFFYEMNLTILPLNPTHHTAGADTWIDHMIVSNHEKVNHHGQMSVPGISKHDLIYYHIA